MKRLVNFRVQLGKIFGRTSRRIPIESSTEIPRRTPVLTSSGTLTGIHGETTENRRTRLYNVSNFSWQISPLLKH